MNFVTRKHLPRRTLLKGMGAAVALPLLDAMTPAVAGAARAKAPVRMIFGYVPNGIIMRDWTPKREGRDFEFTRILKPLESFRQDLVVLSGLAHRTGEGPAGDHARAGGTFLTGVCPKRTTSADVEVGISVDQVAAQALGGRTRLPSLELGCEATRMVGSCDAGYSCAYINSMSWRSATTPNPPETNPRSVFERLYGSLDTTTDPAERARLKENRKSVLDYVNEQTRGLASALGASDRRKIDEYMAAIRDIETRIARAEGDNQDVAPAMEKPTGVPFAFPEHVRLMHDLLIVALQADITRISTLIYAKEGSNRSYPELGFSDPHHPLTHHRNNAEWIEKVTRINCHHVEQFAYFLGRLKAIPDGDGTLLDHSMVVYGSSISDGNIHWHKDLPVLLAGRGDGSLKPGRHLVYPETPMTNLYLTLLDRMGVPAERLGDSNGKLEHIAGV
jgi:uncharacterized protein DUF1552